jgi:hypothetical protein
MSTDWAQKLKDSAQPHVPEPVVAVGMLQPAGAYGAFGAGQLSGIAGSFMRRSSNKKAGGLAKQGLLGTKLAMIVLTEAHVYAFGAKPSGRSWKVLDQLGEWERSDLTFIVDAPGKMSTKVTVDVASTGDRFELEAMTAMSGADLARPFLDAISPS